MCGIIGIIPSGENKISESVAEKMLSPLSKRGPDDKGILNISGKFLGQTRLSIIDLALGHQPMKDSPNDIYITFNGEIYNYKELKSQLEKLGHEFKTNSDTEVIIKLYKEYGENCVGHLNGMFAFIIWDNEREILFMARDRFGKKPLYYAKDSEGNLFLASEIKSIFETGKILGEIDEKSLDNYLALGYIPPWKTIYKNIHTLAPAECATYKNGELEKSKYWKLKDEPLNISHLEAKEKIKDLFEKSVKSRMVADVEVGSFLSGGVDSTLVTTYAQREQAVAGRKIKTFSLGYGENNSELPYAKEASDKIGTEHYTLEAKEEIIKNLEKTLSYFDEPNYDTSNFPQSILSGLAKTKVKVALSGDGADELFMGYGWYQKHMNLSFRKHFFDKFLNPFSVYLRNISIFNESERKKLWKKNNVNSFLDESIREEKINSIKKINLFDLTEYLPGQLLSKIDRMGMMNSLEVRSPFLDYKLAEFVYNLPVEFKMNRSENKIIIKDILSELMPKSFVYRKKQGFGAPVKDWLLEKDVKEYLLKKLGNNNALIYRFLNKDFVDTLIKDFYDKNYYENKYKIWNLLSLEIWMEMHKKYHV